MWTFCLVRFSIIWTFALGQGGGMGHVRAPKIELSQELSCTALHCTGCTLLLYIAHPHLHPSSFSLACCLRPPLCPLLVASFSYPAHTPLSPDYIHKHHAVVHPTCVFFYSLSFCYLLEGPSLSPPLPSSLPPSLPLFLSSCLPLLLQQRRSAVICLFSNRHVDAWSDCSLVVSSLPFLF